MKNVFRLLLAAFVLLGTSSCTLMTDGGNLGEGSESLAFCFRANTDPTGAATNKKLTVSISDGKHTQTFETDFNDSAVSHEFKKVPKRKRIRVYAKVEEIREGTSEIPREIKLLYEGATDIVIKRGKNSVNLGLNPFSGYFWIKESSQFIKNYNNPATLRDIPSPLFRTPNTIVDYSFAPNGDVWLLVLDESNLTTKIEVNKWKTSNVTDISLTFGTEIEKIVTTTIAAEEDTLYFGGYKLEDSVGSKPWLCSVKNDKDFKDQDLSESTQILNTKVGMITDISVAGKNIYIKNENDEIFKGLINGHGQSVEFYQNAIFNTAEMNNENKNSNFIISDMMAIDNDLYVLVIDNGDGAEGNNHSRGALVKINAFGNMTVVGLHNNDIGNESNPLYIMDSETPEKSNMINNNFVGPRRFIAIKPKKVVIADSGAIVLKDQKNGGIKLKQRVVTIDLMNLTNNFSCEDVTEGLFDGVLAPDGSGNLDYKTGFHPNF